MDTNEIIRLILNLVRKGTILAVDHDAAKCRVTSGALSTNWLPWVALAAGETRDWNPPTKGEQVLLICPGGDPADGLVLRGLYSTDAPAPSTKPTFHTRAYPDGAVIEYDHAAHAMTARFPEGASVLIVSPSSVEVRTAAAKVVADTVILDTPNATITGDLRVDGAISAGQDITTPADVKAGAISLTGHEHMEQGDGKKVSKPL